MKNFILLLFFLFLNTGLLFSQDNSSTYYNGIRIFDNRYSASKGDSIMRANKIASMQKTVTEKKSGKERIRKTIIYKFDENGRRTSYEAFNRKNKLLGFYHDEFDQRGFRTATTNKSGRKYYKTEYVFGSYKEAVVITSYKGSSLLNMNRTRTVMNSFNADSNKISSLTYDKNGALAAKVLYEYDTLKKLGTATMYDRKGKLKHSWNFDCSKQGEIEKKSKEEKICKNKVLLANGHTQEITIDESKNNINRNIIEYDEKGKFVMQEDYTGKSGTVLNYRTESTISGDTTYYKLFYYTGNERKNYLRTKNEYVYAGKRTISQHSEYYWRKNKLSESMTSTYIYNYSGLIEHEVVIDELKKTAKVNSYTYTRH